MADNEEAISNKPSAISIPQRCYLMDTGYWLLLTADTHGFFEPHR
jgi:hypothetical protein